MNNIEMNKIVAELNLNPELKKNIVDLVKDNVEQAQLKISEQLGFSLSKEDCVNLVKHLADNSIELSDDHLDSVSGGLCGM